MQKEDSSLIFSPLISYSFSAGQVTGGIVEHTVPHVSTGKHHLQLQVSPVVCGKVLDEHHHFLEIELLKLL